MSLGPMGVIHHHSLTQENIGRIETFATQPDNPIASYAFIHNSELRHLVKKNGLGWHWMALNGFLRWCGIQWCRIAPSGLKWL